MKKALAKKSKHMQVSASHYCQSKKKTWISLQTRRVSFDSCIAAHLSESLWTLFNFIQHIYPEYFDQVNPQRRFLGKSQLLQPESMIFFQELKTIKNRQR